MTYTIVGIIILLGIFFLLKKKRSKSKNAIVEIPEFWHDFLIENVNFYKQLTSKEDQLKFRKRMLSFLNNVTIEAVSFKLEDVDSLLVAASAVIPIFNFENWNYPNLNTVLIYPDYFNENLQFANTEKDRNIGGLVGTGRFENQMILSKKALYHGFSNKTDKGNTGVHEFVHLLDKLDGSIDGVPERLLNNKNVLPWLDLMHNKIEAINNDASDIRNYGGTSKEEFFAVASEYFFERPKLLKRKHPELYQMLFNCFSSK